MHRANAGIGRNTRLFGIAAIIGIMLFLAGCVYTTQPASPLGSGEEIVPVQFIAGEVLGQIANDVPSYVAGAVEWLPTAHLVVAVDDEAATAKVEAKAAELGWRWPVEVRVARWTDEELGTLSDSLREAMRVQPWYTELVVAGGYNAVYSKVNLYTPDAEALKRALAESGILETVGITLDDIEFRFQAEPMVPLEAIGTPTP